VIDTPLRHAGLVPASTGPLGLGGEVPAGTVKLDHVALWTPEQVRGDEEGGVEL